MHFLAFLLQSDVDPEVAKHLIVTMMAIIPIIILIGLAIIIVPFWFICKKAGFSPWLSLLNIIPLGNLVLIYMLAFADWKVIPAPLPAWPPQPPYPPQPPMPPQG
jgi:hypothetical protein